MRASLRMPYELLADGQQVDLGHRRYLLSPQDLAALDVLPDLIRLGVARSRLRGAEKSGIRRCHHPGLPERGRSGDGGN